jgi:hypothetical protein
VPVGLGEAGLDEAGLGAAPPVVVIGGATAVLAVVALDAFVAPTGVAELLVTN